jgi:hypothetical protein
MNMKTPSMFGFQRPDEKMSGSFSNGKELTVRELEFLENEYPQGWSYYAGDTCKHGVYVGGCGADYMCQACEMEE